MHTKFDAILHQAIDIARWTPSSHNCQPWKLISLNTAQVLEIFPKLAFPDCDRFLLVTLDRARILKALPNLSFEMYLSCGMFAGILGASFEALGCQCSWHWIEDTVANIQAIESQHCCQALVLMALKATQPTNSSALKALRRTVCDRRTHRAPFKPERLNEDLMTKMLTRHWPQSLTGDLLKIHIEHDVNIIKEVSRLIKKFAALDFSCYKAWKETYRYLHFDPNKPVDDGFYLQSLMGPMSRLRSVLMQVMLAPKIMQLLRIIQLPQKMANQLAKLVSTSAQLVRCSLPENQSSPKTLVQSGARLMEFWLNAQKFNIAIHPLSVMLQHDVAHAALQALLNESDRIIFFSRLGYIDQHYSQSPRRQAHSILTH